MRPLFQISEVVAYENFDCRLNLQALLGAQKSPADRQEMCKRILTSALLSYTVSSWYNVKEMYDGIKQAINPTKKKATPLTSATGKLTQGLAKQMECWL